MSEGEWGNYLETTDAVVIAEDLVVSEVVPTGLRCSITSAS